MLLQPFRDGCSVSSGRTLGRPVTCPAFPGYNQHMDRKKAVGQGRSGVIFRRPATVLHDSNDTENVLEIDGSIAVSIPGAECMYDYCETEALEMNFRELVLVPEERKNENLALIRQLAICDFTVLLIHNTALALDVYSGSGSP